MTQPYQATAVGKTVFGMSKEAFITAGGIVTSVAVAVLGAAIARFTGFDLLSLNLWVVVPAGAIMGGFAAASGYFVAARWTQTMPSSRLKWDMVGIGLSTWLLAHWLDYATARLNDGTAVSSVVGFWRYWQVATEHMSMRISANYSVTNGVDTGGLGNWGYAVEALQIAGFLVGGFAMYRTLDEQEKCLDCRKYASVAPLLEGVSAETFDQALEEASVTLPELGNTAAAALGKARFVGLSLHKATCPQCKKAWLRPSVIKQSGKSSPDSVRLGSYSAEPEMLARLATACRTYWVPKKSKFARILRRDPNPA